MSAPKRLSNIVKYIIEHFNQKTKRNDKSYIHNVTTNIQELVTAKDRKKVAVIKEKIRLSGFNSIFAVQSIEMAKKYYTEFEKQQKSLPEIQRLKIVTIYSFGINEEEIDGVTDENSEYTSGLDESSREFLESAIKDYNRMFKTSYNTSSDKFQNYYKDVSERVKNREIDLLIVVNMFLTGFDATTLNTLWVDKNLRLHGLLQAYSRTNRILNSIKTFGNIICFRNLEKATNESISLFGDKEASGIVLLKTYKEYYNGYEKEGKTIRGYKSLVEELQDKFPIGERILGEKNQKDFIKLYGGILRVRNILTTFDEFDGNEILTERDVQDYHSLYIDLYNEFRKSKDTEKENINDDIVFEMELIKQIEINIDYILKLIKKYHEEHTKETGEIDVLRPAEIINPVQTDISHDEVLDRDKVLDEIENPEKIEVTTSIPINIIKDKSVIIPEIDNNVPLIVETKNEIPTANIMENKLTATTKAPIQEKKIEDGEHQADPYREQIQ